MVTGYELIYGVPDAKGRLRILDEYGNIRHNPVNTRTLKWEVDEVIRLQFNARHQQQNRDPCPSCHRYSAPECLEVMGQIGRGTFGSVFLVHNSMNGKLMAMKTMEKKTIMKKIDKPENVAQERILLGSVHFPFIVQVKKFSAETVNYFSGKTIQNIFVAK